MFLTRLIYNIEEQKKRESKFKMKITCRQMREVEEKSGVELVTEGSEDVSEITFLVPSFEKRCMDISEVIHREFEL